MVESPLFARALLDLDSDLRATSPSSADLVFDDDLPVRLTLHPDSETVLVDAFAFDASELPDEAGVVASRLLLQLNGLSLTGRPFAIGLTPSGIVAVTVRHPLAEAAGGALLEPITYAATQARGVRDLLAALGSADGEGIAAFST